MNDPGFLFRPWMPVLMIAGLATVLMLLAVFAAARSWSRAGWRSTLLLAMRIIGIAGISLLLFGPSRRQQSPQNSERPALAILLDSSQSMTTVDCGSSSRMTHAAETVLTAANLARLSKDYEVTLEGFDTSIRPLDAGEVRSRPDDFARGRETHLAEAVSAALKRTKQDGQALLVISDGRDTSGDPIQRTASDAASRKVPIFTVALGSASTTPDAALMALAMQDSLLPDEPGSILVRVYQSGLAGQNGRIHVRRDDADQTFPIAFTQADFTEVKVPIREKAAGQYEYNVSLDPLGDEAELANNAQPVFVEVMNRRLRVLVVEGEPYWDTKFLCQSLRKDEQVEVVQLTQIGDLKRETLVARATGETTKLPATSAEWAGFDVVILGKGIDKVFDVRAARALREYVEAGGHVVMARSRPYDPAFEPGGAIAAVLKPIEPVRWTGGQWPASSLQLSASGRTASWLSAEKSQLDPDDAFRRLPPLDHLDQVGALSPAAIVLAESNPDGGGDPHPAIVTMSVGRGSSLVFLGDGFWRWSLLTPEIQDLRGFYDLFWSNLVRWLVFGGDFPPGQQASLQLSRRSVRLGDEVTIDVAYRFAVDGAAAPSVEVTHPDGSTESLPMRRLPGPLPRFRLAYPSAATGVHRVRVETPGLKPAELTARFNVYDVNRERLNTSADPLTLKMLSDLSGAAMLEANDVAGLGDLLTRHRRSLESPPRVEYIWDQAAVMWTLLAWIAAEWVLRRLLGLW